MKMVFAIPNIVATQKRMFLQDISRCVTVSDELNMMLYRLAETVVDKYLQYLVRAGISGQKTSRAISFNSFVTEAVTELGISGDLDPEELFETFSSNSNMVESDDIVSRFGTQLFSLVGDLQEDLEFYLDCIIEAMSEAMIQCEHMMYDMVFDRRLDKIQHRALYGDFDILVWDLDRNSMVVDI